MALNNLILELLQDQKYYCNWFITATDTQKEFLWEEVWNSAARGHSDNEFVQGLYEFYQVRGFLSYKQWCYLIKTVYPNLFEQSPKQIKSLKDRLP